MAPVVCAANAVFNIFDLICGILMFIDSILSFAGTFEGVFLPIYRLLFSALVIIFVFWIPPRLGGMVPFYMNFLGRGFTFIFLGCLCIGGPNDQVGLAAAVITVIIAFIYIILWIFVQFGALACGLPPPFFQPRQASSSSTTTTTTTKENDHQNTTQMTVVTTTTTNTN